LLTQRVGDEVAGLQGLAVSLTVAALVATAIGGPAAFGHLTPSVLATGVVLGLLVPLLPFCLELLALRRLTTAAFGTMMALEPAIAVLIGLIVLRQVPHVGGLAGVALVVAAGIGAERAGRRPARSTASASALAGDGLDLGPSRPPGGRQSAGQSAGTFGGSQPTSDVHQPEGFVLELVD
jgi:inner membrane transporter RhtA